MSLENYLRELEKLADEAHQGKWEINEETWEGDPSIAVSIENDRWQLCGDQVLDPFDAKFIAAANPQTIKALIKVARAAKETEKLFMDINDGFFTGLVPPEFSGVSKSLRELEQLATGQQAESED